MHLVFRSEVFLYLKPVGISILSKLGKGKQEKEDISQPAITCSKLTIQTLEQGVKYVLVSLLLTLNIFHTLL